MKRTVIERFFSTQERFTVSTGQLIIRDDLIDLTDQIQTQLDTFIAQRNRDDASVDASRNHGRQRWTGTADIEQIIILAKFQAFGFQHPAQTNVVPEARPDEPMVAPRRSS